MRMVIVAVGRAAASSECDLTEHYLKRAARAGKALGFTRIGLVELPESRLPGVEERKAAEAEAIARALPAGAVIVALDERGENLGSVPLSERIARLRDAGTGDMAFVIGGPDGHGPKLLTTARFTLAFGAATWPHLLVRAMLAEQIYRIVTILSGHPYHRV